MPFSYPFYTLFMPFSYPFQTLFMRFSYPFHTLGVILSYPLHTSLMLCSYPVHTPFHTPSMAFSFPFSCPFHTLFIAFLIHSGSGIRTNGCSVVFEVFSLSWQSTDDKQCVWGFDFPLVRFCMLFYLFIPLSYPFHTLIMSFSYPLYTVRNRD